MSLASVADGRVCNRRRPTPTYSWVVRALHWILARMGLLQTVILFLWIAERAQHNRELPISPWMIYTHAVIGFIGSTGLSVRFLSRISLYALCAAQLHMAYIYLMEPKLGYTRWLRVRVTTRCIASGAIYLRMLGIQQPDGQMPTTTKPRPSLVYTIALGLISVSNIISSLLCLPVSVATIDREAQLVEQTSLWNSLTVLAPIANTILCLSLGVASLCHSLPLLMYHASVSIDHTLNERAFRLGDKLTFFSYIGLVICHDSNINHWVRNGSDFWLHCQLLLNCFIVCAGISVTTDLSRAAAQTNTLFRKER
ncbi:unnamed protein product [Dicrocoelium dendriticum]|nr:unnamed protein product [Dicrocoelium dendriticum]